MITFFSIKSSIREGFNLDVQTGSGSDHVLKTAPGSYQILKPDQTIHSHPAGSGSVTLFIAGRALYTRTSYRDQVNYTQRVCASTKLGHQVLN